MNSATNLGNESVEDGKQSLKLLYQQFQEERDIDLCSLKLGESRRGRCRSREGNFGELEKVLRTPFQWHESM